MISSSLHPKGSTSYSIRHPAYKLFGVSYIFIYFQILCSQSSKLEDLSQKPEVENISNSDIKMKNDWHEDLNNTDKHGRNNVTADNTFIFSPDFTLQMDKIYKQNTEREQNKSKSERYLGTGMLIRLLSIDYAVMMIIYIL